MLPEALPPSASFRTKRRYFVLRVISQQGNGNRRRMQLPKCVYRHCGTAAAYVAWSCAKENNLHSCCVSWMSYLFLEAFQRLHCYSGGLLPTRHVLFLSHLPICVNMDPHWCVSHDDSKKHNLRVTRSPSNLQMPRLPRKNMSELFFFIWPSTHWET